MRRNHRLKCSFEQFSYEHCKLDKRICRICRSVDELLKMLDCMCQKKKKPGEKEDKR